MASERKVKLTLDGEKEFKSRLSSINAQTKALNSEMKAVTSSFDKNTTAEEKNRKTSELLAKAQEAYQKKIDTLKERIDEATESFGENSDYVNKLKAQMYNAEAQMNKMTKSVTQVDDAVEDASDSTLTFSDVLSANLLGGLIQKGIETLASKFVDMAKAVIEFGTEVVALADDLNTLSATTNLSTETLQEFRYASAFVDVEESTLTGSLTKLTRSMYSASQGTASSVEAFEQLGINIKNTDGSLRSRYDVFLESIDALGRIDDETTRDGIAMQIFGKSAQALNPLIKAGSSVLKDYRQQARDVGYVLDQETLNSLNGVNDEVDRMKLQFEALKNQLGIEVAPVIHEVIEALKEFVGAVDWETVGQVIYVALMTIVGVFQARYYIVKAVVDVFVWLGQIFEAIPEQVSRMSEALTGKISEIKESIEGKFKEVIDGAKQWGKDLIQGFIDGIKAKISALGNAVRDVASTIWSQLHFSRPETGLLRDYEKWMPDMVEGLANSLTASSYKLTNAVAGMTGGIAGAMTLNLGGITINGVADETQINNMVTMIERKLGQRLYR